jgi:hypothetical protein
VDEFERNRPTRVYCFVNKKSWKMGLFVWQEMTRDAEILTGEEAARAVASVNGL